MDILGSWRFGRCLWLIMTIFIARASGNPTREGIHRDQSFHPENPNTLSILRQIVRKSRIIQYSNTDIEIYTHPSESTPNYLSSTLFYITLWLLGELQSRLTFSILHARRDYGFHWAWHWSCARTIFICYTVNLSSGISPPRLQGSTYCPYTRPM